jgi:ECF transporter S component (folate family)
MKLKDVSVRAICEMAMLIAFEVVFTRLFAFNTSVFKIGIGFLAMAFCGMLFGPWWAVVCYFLSDLIGTMIFPTGGYNPAFSVTVILMGAVYGLFLHREDVKFWRHMVPAALIYSFVLSWGLNTFWIHYFYGATFMARLLTRLPQCLFDSAVQFVCLPLLKILRDRLKKANLIP